MSPRKHRVFFAFLHQSIVQERTAHLTGYSTLIESQIAINWRRLYSINFGDKSWPVTARWGFRRRRMRIARAIQLQFSVIRRDTEQWVTSGVMTYARLCAWDRSLIVGNHWFGRHGLPWKRRYIGGTFGRPARSELMRRFSVIRRGVIRDTAIREFIQRISK